MLSRRCSSFFVLLFAGAFCLLANNSAQTQQYRMTLIAEKRETQPPGISAPGINDRGMVAYMQHTDFVYATVYKSDGIHTTRIADTATLGWFFEDRLYEPFPVSINNLGRAAFIGLPTGGITAYSGDGGPVTTVAETGPIFSGFGYTAQINDANQVTAYITSRNPTHTGLYIGDGTSLSPLYTQNTFQAVGSHHAINNRGEVAFAAQRTPQESGIYRGKGSSFTLLSSHGSDIVSMNENGVVAYVAYISNQFGLYHTFDGTPSLIVDTSGELSNFVSIAINDHNQAAYLAQLDRGGFGIYTGSDLLSGRIIGTGDTLYGSTVVSLKFWENGFNNLGQIAFTARLADNRYVVLRADPVPESGSLVGICGIILTSGFLWQQQRRRRKDRIPYGSARTRTADSAGLVADRRAA